MKVIFALDDHIVALFQEAYLWLWDRTGVFVATLMFLTYAGSIVCMRPPTLVDLGFIAFFGVFSAQRYIAQTKDLRLLNVLQRILRDFIPRVFVTYMIFGFIVSDALQLNAWHAIGDALFVSWNYLGCVQVRDREPKEFFPSRKLVGAGA